MWIELDRVPSRNRGSAWDKGRLFSFVAPPSPLFLSSSRGGWSEGREESGATVVNSAAKREDFSASSNL